VKKIGAQPSASPLRRSTGRFGFDRGEGHEDYQILGAKKIISMIAEVAREELADRQRIAVGEWVGDLEKFVGDRGKALGRQKVIGFGEW